MLVTTPSGVPFSRLLGYILCEQFAGECRGVQTCVQCPAKSTKQHVTIQLLLSAETCRRVFSAL